MQSFAFENIWMVSRRDRRARHISFHPLKNLIHGRNHTGKSSVIKTLFVTMGARPQGELNHWDASTASVVQFRVGERVYRALHHRNARALFSDTGELLVAAQAYSDWCGKFADVTGFNLPLTDKNGKIVVGDPRCFFLPFYINQDGSWLSNWSTFVGLQQYQAPYASILEYFSGIKPPTYYEARTEREREQKVLADLRRERTFLERARSRFGKTLTMSGPKLDPANFDSDMSRLSTEVTELNKRQEALRETAVKERELATGLAAQIQLVEVAMRSYDGDSKLLRQVAREPLVCPTCHAQHAEPFVDLLSYSEDARVLQELASRLREDLREVKAKSAKTQAEILSLEENYRKIAGVLHQRRGELRFEQVVDSIGAEKAFRAFEDEGVVIDREIALSESKLAKLDAKMSELTDRNRSKTILNSFRTAYLSALHHLNLPTIAAKQIKLTSRPAISGSGGPRAILAYYAALWRVCAHYGSFAVPLIVDSPNQQGQDEINLPKVMSFLTGMLPTQAQFILGSEIDVEHEFDKKIVLDEPYSVLREKEFEEVGGVVDPLLAAMFGALKAAEEQ